MAIGPYKTPKVSKYFGENGKVKELSHPLPPPAAGGPQGKWMENRLEKTDAPIISSEAKKSYLRVKKSRTLA